MISQRALNGLTNLSIISQQSVDKRNIFGELSWSFSDLLWSQLVSHKSQLVFSESAVDRTMSAQWTLNGCMLVSQRMLIAQRSPCSIFMIFAQNLISGPSMSAQGSPGAFPMQKQLFRRSWRLPRDLAHFWSLNGAQWTPSCACGKGSLIMIRWWGPQGRYCHRLCTAIAPFWFSTEHLWTVLIPFWLSTDIMWIADGGVVKIIVVRAYLLIPWYLLASYGFDGNCRAA